VRAILVGQAPGPRGDHNRPLEGASFRKLCRWAGVPWDVYISGTERTNLFRRFPGKAGPKGDKFNARLGRRRAEKVLPRCRGRLLVLIGWGVAAAFGARKGISPFVIYHPRGGGAAPDRHPRHFVVIPHPSGVSHFYNDQKNRRRAGACLRAVLDPVL